MKIRFIIQILSIEVLTSHCEALAVELLVGGVVPSIPLVAVGLVEGIGPEV